jgi:putative transposase
MGLQERSEDRLLASRQAADNAFCESFNGTFRSECLNTNWFSNLEDAKRIIEAWRREYKVSRPHRAFDYRTPEEFVSQIAASRNLAEAKQAEN